MEQTRADVSASPAAKPAERKSRATTALTVKSVAGGIVVTLLTIGLVELASKYLVKIPRPSSLYLLAVAAAALLGGMRSGLISALIVFAFSAYMTHIPGQDHFPVYTADQTTRLTLFGLTAPAMAVLVGLLRRRNDALLREGMRREAATERAAEQAARTTRQVQADLDREHRIAVTLQSALLSPLPAEGAFAGVGIGYCYQAASNEAEVGGDFYDVVALDATTIAVVIGDVSGKGLAAATKTAEVKFTLRTVLHDLPDPSAVGQALARVNRMLAAQPTPRQGRENQAAALPPVTMPVFVCLAVAVLDRVSGVGAMAVAGMEPPLVLRLRPEGIAGEIFDVGGLPIGVLPDAGYEAVPFCLDVGETLLFSTDGLTESRRRGSPTLFGIEGLRSAAETAFGDDASNSGDKSASLSDRATQIVDAAKAFSGEPTLKDDACVLLVQRQ